MYYRHIIYQNFQKKIFYNMNICLTSNKFYKNLNKTKSVTAIIKPNKNHFKKYQNDFKFISPQFSDVGNHFTLFSIYFIFGEK